MDDAQWYPTARPDLELRLAVDHPLAVGADGGGDVRGVLCTGAAARSAAALRRFLRILDAAVAADGCYVVPAAGGVWTPTIVAWLPPDDGPEGPEGPDDEWPADVDLAHGVHAGPWCETSAFDRRPRLRRAARLAAATTAAATAVVRAALRRPTSGGRAAAASWLAPDHPLAPFLLPPLRRALEAVARPEAPGRRAVVALLAAGSVTAAVADGGKHE